LGKFFSKNEITYFGKKKVVQVLLSIKN